MPIYTTEAELMVFGINPGAGYRVNNWLSLGGGPQVMYANFEIKAKAPPPNGIGEVKIDGDDLAFGFGLGALFELSERTRFGVVYQWKDTWEFAAGVHFRPVEKWLLQLGVSYDTSPVDSDDRTPDMPIDRQIRYATGVQYKWSDRLSIGAQFVYADYGKAKIDNALLQGDYKRNDIFFFAMNANWKF
jgi:long-subunit fatty acid transport protein